MRAARQFKVVRGKSHMGKYNGLIGTAIKVTPRQVCLVFEGIENNLRSRNLGYWFRKYNTEEIK